jgi:hypothetical protein
MEMRYWKFIVRSIVVALFTCLFYSGYAQNPTDSLPSDPGALYLDVNTVQNLSFGAFTQGSSGGTITISSSGFRSATGTVIPLNLGYQYYPAIFDVQAYAGTVITISNGPNITLNGSRGGSMSMKIGNPSPGPSFVCNADPPSSTRVNIGGTLTVGNATASPPGSYSGTFYVTFNYQ